MHHIDLGNKFNQRTGGGWYGGSYPWSLPLLMWHDRGLTISSSCWLLSCCSQQDIQIPAVVLAHHIGWWDSVWCCTVSLALCFHLSACLSPHTHENMPPFNYTASSDFNIRARVGRDSYSPQQNPLQYVTIGCRILTSSAKHGYPVFKKVSCVLGIINKWRSARKEQVSFCFFSKKVHFSERRICICFAFLRSFDLQTECSFHNNTTGSLMCVNIFVHRHDCRNID